MIIVVGIALLAFVLAGGLAHLGWQIFWAKEWQVDSRGMGQESWRPGRGKGAMLCVLAALIVIITIVVASSAVYVPATSISVVENRVLERCTR